MPIDTPSLARQKLAFWLAILLIVSVSLLSFLSTQRLVALASRAEQSQQVLVQLNRLVSSLKDVESGTRGFLLTSDERFLEPFRTGQEQFRRTIGRLHDLTGSDPRLRQRVRRLEELGAERIRVASGAVESRAATSLSPETLQFLNVGRTTMEQVREESEAIIAAQQSTYRERDRAVERQVQLTNAVMAVGVALSLLVIAWLFMIRGREVARRRMAEDELRTLNAELEDRVQERTAEVQRSRELLNTVIENMPDTVFLKDTKDGCRYVLVNEAAERLLGRERTDLLGHVDHELFPREEAEACQREDLHVTTTGRERVVAERVLTTEHGVRLVESRKVPVSDAEGDRRFVLGIVRDVTEQKALEDQMRQMQRMDAVGRLTGGVAHDFNNLLAIILGNVELLRENAAEGSDPAEMADEAISAATRGAELVRRMLAFARMQHLEPTAVDLNERLPSITGLLRRVLREDIELRVETAPRLWSAMVDPTQVDDALVNLAINARDATPNGGSLSIETANVRLDEDYAAHHAEVTPGEYVMLAVSDTGTGMTPDVIARAFEPFFTTKEAGRGTGLGLSQIYGWVKQSGGHIKIYSEVGHGTTIKLYLPRAERAYDDTGEASDQPSAGTGSETILVVEDNPNVRKTVVRQLRDLGYSPLEAENSSEAMDIIRSGTGFDLLLTDIVMPGGVTGYELAEQARELRPDLKVLFTSGYTELAVTNGSEGRTGPLLSKPYRKQDLGRAVRSVLDDAG